MKGIILFFIFYLLFPSFGGVKGDCQPNIDKKRDMQWILGYESNGHSIDSAFGNTIIDFSNGTPHAYFHYTDMNFYQTSASLCDTSGQLFCYTNGIYIANQNDQKMLNGDTIGYSSHWQQYQSFGLMEFQSNTLLLPIPCQEHCAVSVYKQFTNNPNGSLAPLGISYAIIDLQGDNGLGIVTQKDAPFIRDTVSGIMTACRHGNGRDWWIINAKKDLSKYYRSLLSPYGIQHLNSQIMPNAGYTGFQSAYSPDGTKLAETDFYNGVWLYDFDRCNGMLSNRRLLQRPPTIFSFGVAFSPNSRYLYVTSDTSITQYDTQANNIDASKQIVATLDYAQDRGSYMPFMLMQLAPDGKIYINSANAIRYFHVIDRPNLAGTACNVIQHGLRLPCIYNETMPNFPNFRLGALKGSPCDSLGIEAGVTVSTAPLTPPKEDFKLSVFPNPATDYTLLLWESPLAETTVLDVSDAIGQVVFHTILPKETTYYKLPLQNLPVGVYITTLHREGFKVSEKLIHVNP